MRISMVCTRWSGGMNQDVDHVGTVDLTINEATTPVKLWVGAAEVQVVGENIFLNLSFI